MNKKLWGLFLVSVVWGYSCAGIYSQENELKAVIITPSVSTAVKASQLLKNNGLVEAEFDKAECVFVVTRSDLSRPLNYSYPDIQQLRKDIDGQFNILGLKYHMYIYHINKNKSLSQIRHSYSIVEN